MRALVLILTSVVLIAIVQASYATIDKAIDEKNKNEKARSHTHHKQDRHHNHEGHGHKHTTLTNEINAPLYSEIDEPSMPTTNSRNHNGHKHHSAKSKVDEQKYSKLTTSDYDAVYHIPEDRTQYVKENHHNNVRLRIERVETPKFIDFRNHDKNHFGEPTHKKKNKETLRSEEHRVNRMSHFNKSSGDNKRWPTKPHKYELLNFANKSRKSSSLYHKATVYMKSSCTSDKDCDGGCCIQLKNGKSKCKMPNERRVGQKCANSCVCSPGLQCFVATFRKNGQKKINREGKKLWGHCMAQDMADLSKGYFIPTKTVMTNERL